MDAILDKTVEYYKTQTPDIAEHLDTLTELARGLDHITEMGFRYGASFSAFLRANPKKLISYDLQILNGHREYFNDLPSTTKIELHEADTLKIEIEPTDLLFIDTLHTYKQLKQELKLHGNRAKKYLVFHDTVSYAHKGEDGSEHGLHDAVVEFLLENSHWKLKHHYLNNNGLMILERVSGAS